jgi:exopolyphosphatase / guanosine-5'-triphosphate,3'-diphosphate pyrophosphatase
LPNCIAAVDMGTNSFHLIIVETKEDGRFKIIDREREVIRLGTHHEGNELNFISEQEISKAIEILTNFKKMADFYKAELKAVATSAVREAANKDQFINRVKEETGIIVEAIEGKKEAGLIFAGVNKALNLKDKKVLSIDIGGGSTELIHADKSKILFSESIKIGAVRLTKMFFPDFILNTERLQRCDEYIEKLITENQNIIFPADFDVAAGSSGTIQAAAALIRSMNGIPQSLKLNGFVFSKEELLRVSEKILNKKMTEERMTIPGMETKRADIMPAGILILKKLFEIFQINSLTISEFALREGIIIEALERLRQKV